LFCISIKAFGEPTKMLVTLHGMLARIKEIQIPLLRNLLTLIMEKARQNEKYDNGSSSNFTPWINI
jgi:hypothetical protein